MLHFVLLGVSAAQETYVHWPLNDADTIKDGERLDFMSGHGIVITEDPEDDFYFMIFPDDETIEIGPNGEEIHRKQILRAPILTLRLVEVSEAPEQKYLDVEYDVDHELLESYLSGLYIDYLFEVRGQGDTLDGFFQWLRNKKK